MDFTLKFCSAKTVVSYVIVICKRDKVAMYYHSFSGPNVCLARLQMELCLAANIFAAR